MSKLLWLLILCLPLLAYAETLTGRVIRIDDGDTFTLIDSSNQQQTIRLAGIDAPDRMQSFGVKAQANLGSLLSGEKVQVLWQRRNQDGSLLGKVLIIPKNEACDGKSDCPGTLDVGLQQVKDGMAWWHVQSPLEQTAADRTAYQHAEFDAKIHRRGLWTETNPTPPWKWPR